MSIGSAPPPAEQALPPVKGALPQGTAGTGAMDGGGGEGHDDRGKRDGDRIGDHQLGIDSVSPAGKRERAMSQPAVLTKEGPLIPPV